MADHVVLVSEMPVLAKMSAAERLKRSKKRRNVQLKKYQQFEKQCQKENMKQKKKPASKGKVLQFVGSITLLEAAARNDLEEVENLLKGTVSPNVTNEDGLTALHQCCIDDMENLLLLLLRYGANVNSLDSELWTPLHAAATCGHLNQCKILIENGANLLAVNVDGNMPYDICEDEVTLNYIENEMSKQGVTQEIIDQTRLSTEHSMLNDMIVLAENGSDLEFHGRAGETPLHTAAANGYIQVAEFLLKHDVRVDVTDDDLWQPLHAAACWGHLAILELLLQQGASLDAKTKNGETPLDICEDLELRQRIVDMRNKIKSHEATKKPEGVKRGNQNSRRGSALYSSNSSLVDKASASIRRTSMREKTPLALREAREEAQRMEEMANSLFNELEDENKENNLRSNGIFMEEDPLDLKEPETTDKDDTDKPLLNGSHSQSPLGVPSVPVQHAVHNVPVQPAVPSVPVQPAVSSVPVQPAVPSVPVQPAVPSVPVQPAVPSVPVQNSQIENNIPNTEPVVPPVTMSPARSEESLFALPGGTLADLKKQRAQRVQDNLRIREACNRNNAMDDNNQQNHSYSDSENNLVMNTPNKSGLNGIQHKNIYHIGDMPKQKFTASNTEIIGGRKDGNKGCCTIL